MLLKLYINLSSLYACLNFDYDLGEERMVSLQNVETEAYNTKVSNSQELYILQSLPSVPL